MRVSGIWVIRPKAGIVFYRLTDIFNYYNVDRENQNLPVRIDNWIVENPESIVVEKSEIVFVGVNRNPEGIDFINITTQHPLVANKRDKRINSNVIKIK